MVSRRSFVGGSFAAALVSTAQVTPGASHSKSSFLDLHRAPDSVVAYSGLEHRIPLARVGDRFEAAKLAVEIVPTGAGLEAYLTSPEIPLTHLHARWRVPVDEDLLCFGDDWERTYGTLAWYSIVPERVMPWYFATYDGGAVHAYGVETGASALCFWQLDPEGVSLWMDVSNGGEGVELGQRRLRLATVIAREGNESEAPLAALRAFCRQMCSAPLPVNGAVWGVNDWYYAYGHNSQQMLLAMTDLMMELAPGGSSKPFTVVDDGWKDGSSAFPSMAALAASIKIKGARPGIWVRPLIAEPNTDAKLLLDAKRFGEKTQRARDLAFDPTVPEALELVVNKFKQLASWSFELVKHDYSTYDLLGKWGFEMGASPTYPGWHFHDRTRTNAEIIRDLYRSIRQALGDRIQILGCNTVGHLAAGIFEMQRTGDDTSGKDWERTRRMGVNTLAHRLCQHGTFFCLDADCVAITRDVPWMLTSQWLEVVARSKTALFISPDPSIITSDQRKALRDAFALASSRAEPAVPADLFHGTTPEIWHSSSGQKRYSWSGAEGASPFPL